MDIETADMTLRLQLQDISEICGRRKGKEREGDPSPDADLAIDLYRDELERGLGLLSDHRLARSIGRAVHTDGPVLATSKLEEDIAIRDRQLAYRLSGSRPQTPLPVVVPGVDTDDRLADQFAHWNAFESESSAENAGGPLCDQGARKLPRLDFVGEQYQKAGLGHCVACGDNEKSSKLMRATCSHSYCIGCVNELFEYATKDESLFPPRCCRKLIPLSDARPFLDSVLIERFEQTTIELGTHNRTYCHDATCSEFIPPQNIDGDRATCRACSQVTCTICKAWAHRGDCPEDPALKSLMAVAAEAGYQKCYQCQRLVELDTGCNHMTCLCRAQFCYLCGIPWKGCRCARWQEDRLLARAEAVVAREPPAPPFERAERVQRAVNRLRERHECNHGEWRLRQGRQQCEECRYVLANYLLECRQCLLRACVRCTRNRL